MHPTVAVSDPGTLTINSNLSLNAGSLLAYDLGRPNVIGGPLNDHTIVQGDLALDGTLNVITTPGGSFDLGVYRIISYASGFTNNGLEIGTIPSPDFFVQTSVVGAVNLVNTSGLTLNFWDGAAGPKNDGFIQGDIAAQVRFNDLNYLSGRIGGRASRHWIMENGRPFTAWLLANVWNEFLSNAKTEGSSDAGFVPFHSDLTGPWGKAGFGVNAEVGANLSIFATASYQKGFDRGINSIGGNIGLRLNQ
jgi:hypothetical protein